MRRIGADTIPEPGELVLLTVRDLGPGEDVMAADFRDDLALAFKPTRTFIGMDRSGGVRLGRGLPKMRHGVWYLPVDPEAASRWPDVVLSGDNVVMRRIG